MNSVISLSRQLRSFTVWQIPEGFQANAKFKDSDGYRVGVSTVLTDAVYRSLDIRLSPNEIVELMEMAKPGRKPNAAKDAKRSAIMTALKFVSVASSAKGSAPYQEHVQIKNGAMITFDGVLAAGIRIEGADDISANPHTGKLMAALDKCGAEFAVTQLGNDRISIKSGKLRYVVPCLPDAMMSPVFPDNPIAACTPNAIAAMVVAGKLVSDNATTVVEASVLIEGYTVLSTDRKTMIQLMFDCEFPRLTVPKSFVQALGKLDTSPDSLKQPVSFGFSETSFTVFFKDNSFLKTQLYSEGYPDIPAGVLPDNPNGFTELPSEVWVALEKLMPFTGDTDDIFFTKDGLATSLDTIVAATYDIDGMLESARVSAKALKFVEPHCKLSHFPSDKYIFQFFNETKTLRGSIALRAMDGDDKPSVETPQASTAAPGIADAYASTQAPADPPASPQAAFPPPAPPPAAPIAATYAGTIPAGSNPGPGIVIEEAASIPAEPIPTEVRMSQDDATALFNANHLTLTAENTWKLGTATLIVDAISTMGITYWLSKVYPQIATVIEGQMSADIDYDPSLDTEEEVEDNEPDTPSPVAAGTGWTTA